MNCLVIQLPNTLSHPDPSSVRSHCCKERHHISADYTCLRNILLEKKWIYQVELKQYYNRSITNLWDKVCLFSW